MQKLVAPGLHNIIKLINIKVLLNVPVEAQHVFELLDCHKENGAVLWYDFKCSPVLKKLVKVERHSFAQALSVDKD